MKNKELAQRIKILRNRKGFSQEVLSEKTGLSLRTIQRIENGETEPRGDSLKRLAYSLDVSPDEISDWVVKEDNGFLISLNLSALGFIIFPLLGMLIPLIIWVSKKDKIKGINETAKDILNFQITWTILLFMVFIGVVIYMVHGLTSYDDINALSISKPLVMNLILSGVMYMYNLSLIVINSYLIKKGSKTFYYPKITFLRK
jgi:uncharacterized Tic20 family protein/DNA-binding XRE family transcriptional regulator